MNRQSSAIVLDLKALCRVQCAGCLTGIAAEDHDAENVDVRVAMTRLALGCGFVWGSSCHRCGAEKHPAIPSYA
jgi:hypothetical protein